MTVLSVFTHRMGLAPPLLPTVVAIKQLSFQSMAEYGF